MLLKNDIGGLCPNEGFWRGIVFGEIVIDGGLQLGDALEDAAPDALACDLGEEALNEVQPGRRSRNEVQLEAWMPLQPRLNFLCLVRRVVVDDEMEIEMLGYGPVDLLQEPDEFLGAMAGQTFAKDLPGFHVQSSEQRCCAVALVVVRHCGRTALLHRQAWLRAVERLNLALLVDAKHQCLVRRVHVETHDVRDLFGELRIVGELEFARQMRLQARLGPDALYAGVADADLLGHGAHAPMRRIGGHLVRRLRQHLQLYLCCERLLTRGPRLVAQKALNAFCDIALLPAPYARAIQPCSAYCDPQQAAQDEPGSKGSNKCRSHSSSPQTE